MHRCYPECNPAAGFHVSKSIGKSTEQQHKSHIANLEKKLEEAREIAGLAPDPENYEIQDVFDYEDHQVLLVHYPNCTNFDGMKCLVVRSTLKNLVKIKRLDPHFTEVTPENGVEIVARFPPSEEGVANAKTLATNLSQN